MRLSSSRILLCTFTAAALLNSGCKKSAPPAPAQASTQTPAAPAPATDAQKIAFVQTFYDWYVRDLNGEFTDGSSLPSTQALTLKPEAFNPALRTALQKNVAYTATLPSDAAEDQLDLFGAGDPQQSASRFKAGSVSGPRVAVAAFNKGKTTPARTFQVELSCAANQCTIANIWFPAETYDGTPMPAFDLLSSLTSPA